MDELLIYLSIKWKVTKKKKTKTKNIQNYINYINFLKILRSNIEQSFVDTSDHFDY